MTDAPEATRVGIGDRRDDIQGIRALAVLMVVAYHAGLPLPGGFTGPDVFFVVSGFVVTGMLLRERFTTGRIAVVRFYLRRVRRLAPSLGVVGIATLAIAAFVYSPIGTDQQVTALAVGAATTVRANLYFLRQTSGYFQPVAQKNPFLHTWSLSVEEQFYLAFPIALVVLWWLDRRMRGGGRLTLSLIVIGGLASLAACIGLSYGHLPVGWTQIANAIGALDPLRVAFFTPMTRAWEFLAGVVLALITVRWTPGPLVRSAAALVGIVVLVATMARVQSTAVFPGSLAMLPVIGTIGLLIAGIGSGSGMRAPFVSRVLSITPMVWIGDRSYSWYLWHWPLIVFTRAVYVTSPSAPFVAAAVSLVPAALSFQFIEDPIRRRRIWPSSKATCAIAAVSVLLPLACAMAFGAAVERSWGNPQIAEIREAASPNHIDITAACAAMVPLGHPTRARCVWGTPASRGTVLLVGDSHAGHFSEAFIAAANALHYDAEIATAGGCPFLKRPEYNTELCHEFVEGTLAAIDTREPAYAAVIMSSATTGYLDGSTGPDYVADATPGAAFTRPRSIAGWVASVQRAIDAIAPRSPVIVVGAVPQFYQTPQCLHPTLFSAPTPGCGVWTAQWAAAMRTDIMVEERAAVEARGATYLDAGARLCSPEKGCSAFIDGKVAYRDGGHLSVRSSMAFEPDFRAALTAATSRHGAAVDASR